MQLHGMRLDGKFSDSAQQTWAYAKNILLSRGFDEIENEPGDTLIDSSITGSIKGRITTPNDIILFTVDGTAVLIRHLSSVGTLTTILTTTTTYYNISGTTIYIEGVHCYNNEGDLIIAWTDGTNKPMILNVTHAHATPITIDAESELKDYYLFPEFNHNNFTLSNTSITTGGRLPAAAYFVSLTYELEPEVNTNFGGISNPIFIVEEDSLTSYKQFKGNGTLVITNKGFIINITDIDITRDYFKLVVIQKTETGTNCFITKRIKITAEAKLTNGLTSVLIDDLSKLIPFNLTEVVTSSPAYNVIKSITQSNKKLRLFGLTKPQKLPLADIYNNVISKITVNWIEETLVALSSTKNSYKDSAFIFNSKGFRDDEVYALYIGLHLKSGGYYGIYHIPGRVEIGNEHTATDVDGTSYDAYKINSSATFDGNYYGKMGFWENENEVYPTGYGTLGNGTTKVRHHRFPSAKQIQGWKGSLISSYTDIGNELIEAQGVLGLRISLDWATVDSGTKANLENIIDGWEIFYAKRTLNNQLMLDQSLAFSDGIGFRFYGFDSMSNLLNIEPTHIKADLYAAATDIITSENNNEVVNYTTGTSYIDKLTKIKYLPAYNTATLPSNEGKENCYYFERTGGTGAGLYDKYLVNFINIKDNVYLDFSSQELVSCGIIKKLTDTGYFSFYGGDTFIGHNSVLRFEGGIGKVWYFPVQSILNSGMRYEGNNNYEKFYPLTDITAITVEAGVNIQQYILDMIAAGVANYYFYNNDYHLLNTFRQDNIDNELTSVVNSYPNRIQSSIPQPLDSSSVYWRKFKILDYFDMVNNKGAIYKAIGNENIVYIQTQYSIFRGIIVDKLITGDIDVALKSSEMFDRPLEELLDADGTFIRPYDREGMILTPYGLCVVDLYKGSIFVISDKANEISKLGIEDWFRTTVKTTMTFGTPETVSNGVILGYDDIYKRLLVTIKNSNPNTISNLTLSFQFEKMQWVCFHRYTPDRYIWNANGLYRIDSISVSKMLNSGYGYALTITSVTKTSTLVTVTTTGSHNLKTGDTILVSSADIVACNGLFLITVTGLTTFTFSVLASTTGTVSNAVIIASDPSIIDFVFNSNKSERFLVNNIKWTTNIEASGINYWDETISRLLLYSKNLCSELITIVKRVYGYNSSTYAMEETGNTAFKDGEWVYDDIKDYLTTPNSIVLDANFKLVDASLNLSKLYYEKSKFISKFVIVRIIYNNSSTTKKLRISNIAIEAKNIL